MTSYLFHTLFSFKFEFTFSEDIFSNYLNENCCMNERHLLGFYYQFEIIKLTNNQLKNRRKIAIQYHFVEIFYLNLIIIQQCIQMGKGQRWEVKT